MRVVTRTYFPLACLLGNNLQQCE